MIAPGIDHFALSVPDLDAHIERLQSVEAPHRREPARMHTSYLNEGGGLEVQLVTYDEPR